MNQDATSPAVTLRYETKHIAVVTMSNPPHNALSWSSRKALIGHLEELEADEDVRCLVLTGAGRSFTAGADLREDQVMQTDQLHDFVQDFDRILSGIEHFRAPVIGAINGATIGGGLEVALACDLRIASEDAFFVAAGVNVGLIANFWRLVRICGLGPAKEILLTGERYSARQALGWGLVTEVHSSEELMEAALRKARRIASRAPLSVEATKACVNAAPELDRETAGELQVAEIARMFATQDHKEALLAFFERRDGDYHRR